MALLHYRDLVPQNPSSVTGDTITTVSETDSDTAKRISVHDIAPHVSPSKYSAFRARKVAKQTISTPGVWEDVTFPLEDFDEGGEYDSNKFVASETGFYYFQCLLYVNSPNEPTTNTIQVRITDGFDIHAEYSAEQGSTGNFYRSIYIGGNVFTSASENVWVQFNLTRTGAGVGDTTISSVFSGFRMA